MFQKTKLLSRRTGITGWDSKPPCVWSADSLMAST
jgi:hypothetical protein